MAQMLLLFYLFALRMFVFFSFDKDNHIKPVVLALQERLEQDETACSTSTTKNNQKPTRFPSPFFILSTYSSKTWRQHYYCFYLFFSVLTIFSVFSCFVSFFAKGNHIKHHVEIDSYTSSARNNQNQLGFHHHFPSTVPLVAKHGLSTNINFICFSLYWSRLLFCFLIRAIISNP